MKTTLRFYKGYWTLYSGSQAVLSFANAWDALEFQAEFEGECYA